MPVVGFEIFRERFAPHAESFCLIGGSACDLLFGEVGERFRATKDLDIVVLVEAPYEGFARELWAFVRDGGYKAGSKNDEEAHYYRFSLPTEEGYPKMIELFAKHPGFLLELEDTDIAPLPVDGAISSLSAILLDDDYYSFLREGITYIDGIGVVDAIHLVPLKAKAHVDLNARKAAGNHVNENDLKKHKKDVLRLAALIPLDLVIYLPQNIADDMELFFAMIENDETLQVSQLDLSKDLPGLIEELRSHYATNGTV